MGWQKRREKLMVQEGCYFQWQNLIAEASRRGYVGEEELQWDSYKILNQQLQQEWLESVEERKMMPKLKGSKRAPKSLEQRRRISEAISAKWSDPAYRQRVSSALAKYHGIPEGAPRKPQRRPRGDAPSARSPAKKSDSNKIDSAWSETKKSQYPKTRLKKSNSPMYEDPLANAKLEMIKNIRAQRAASETKKTKAIERARLLIAEAEKAAKALEVAATRSPLACASLMETKKLIAEAIQSVESIKVGQLSSNENSRDASFSSAVPVNHDAETEMDEEAEGLNPVDQWKVNGTKSLESSKSDNEDFDFGKFTWQNLLNGDMDHLSTSSGGYGLSPLDLDSLVGPTLRLDQNLKVEREDNPLLNRNKLKAGEDATHAHSTVTTKKWVRGRLVEVAVVD